MSHTLRKAIIYRCRAEHRGRIYTVRVLREQFRFYYTSDFVANPQRMFIQFCEHYNPVGV